MPVDCPEERLRILPTKGLLKHIIQSWSASMDQDKINDVVNKNSGFSALSAKQVKKSQQS